MCFLQINKNFKKEEGQVIGNFADDLFNCDIYWEPDEKILSKSIFLFLGQKNNNYVIVVGDSFLKLEKKYPDVAKVMCLHEEGHIKKNCITKNSENVDDEIKADLYAFDKINGNKKLMNMMYTQIIAEMNQVKKKFTKDYKESPKAREYIKIRRKEINKY